MKTNGKMENHRNICICKRTLFNKTHITCTPTYNLYKILNNVQN